MGHGKIKYLVAEHGAGAEVMAALKKTLDPDNILNPGKIVEVERETPIRDTHRE